MFQQVRPIRRRRPTVKTWCGPKEKPEEEAQYLYGYHPDPNNSSAFIENMFDTRDFSKYCSGPLGTFNLSFADLDFENKLNQRIVAGVHPVGDDLWIVAGGRGISQGNSEQSCVLEEPLTGFKLFWGNGPEPPVSRRRRAYIPSSLGDIDFGTNATGIYEGLENVCGVPKNDSNFYQIVEYPDGTRVNLQYALNQPFGPAEVYAFPFESTFALTDMNQEDPFVDTFQSDGSMLRHPTWAILGKVLEPLPQGCLDNLVS